ncbi:Arc family DNA-binding protein [Massilia forsythiae]|uniref:Arc family DNA-binding protein n=1 Tax=Massilia forsythiae TaxID=2728020 RepID=A0A7Z2VWR3_9BURK|nr:Arc family DNA-binding protein [Massilia forsythiae]QJE00666.1 Arc family DNA-binding protein [Massilia forsythiae]
MSRKDPQLNLRLPADLKNMLEDAAEANNRSVTAETVERLRASFSSDRDTANTLFLLSRLEVRAAEAEMDLLRHYAIAFQLYDQVKLLSEELPELKNMSSDERASEIASKSDLQRVLKMAENHLRFNEGSLPIIEMAKKMSDELSSLKFKSDKLLQETIRRLEEK